MNQTEATINLNVSISPDSSLTTLIKTIKVIETLPLEMVSLSHPVYIFYCSNCFNICTFNICTFEERHFVIYQTIVSSSVGTVVLIWRIVPKNAAFEKCLQLFKDKMSSNALSEIMDSVTLWTLLITAMNDSRLWMLILDRAVKYFRKFAAFLQTLKQN